MTIDPSHSVPETGNGSSLVFCADEFPCDNPLEIFRQLHLHSKKSNFPILAKFISECSAILMAEVWKLPRSYRRGHSEFHSLLGLASDVLGDVEYQAEAVRVPFEGALLCAMQISLLIGNFEAENIEYDPRQQNLAVAAVRTGLFAAAAISVSRSLAELAFIGPEAVRAAFRFHIHVDQISQLVEPRPAQGRGKCWGYAVVGVREAVVRKEVGTYNSKRSSSAPMKVRITHADKNSVGVAGPPSRVQDFFQSSTVLHHADRLPLKILSGLCHAADVYGQEDVKAITGALALPRYTTCTVQTPLLSPSTGVPYAASNVIQIFDLVCEEMLTKSHCRDNVVERISSAMIASGIQDCKILSHGKCAAPDQILSDLKLHHPAIRFVLHDLVDWTTKDIDNCTAPVTDRSKLAVVGMSCRMPGGANDTELLFELLADGRDVHTRVPIDRFDLETHYDPSGNIENASETPFGNFIDNPGHFDASFFNISPREAEQTDPMHRLALVTAYEALEMAGFSPNRTPSTNLKRVGTFYGVASDDYREVNAGQNIDTYATPGGERAFANGRINYFFKFGGPSLSIDTACSSSGAAINAACSALWAGDVDMALAGGLNIITNPDNYCMLSKGHFLSKTGQCKVWSKEADGYCRADGIGCVVIKRLEDAVADNDNIIATILAAATNHSADAISITHPHAGAQRDNYHQVLQQAGVNPLDVSYIELHGTGTQAGDGVESNSVADVFAPVHLPRSPNNPLYLGAIKSNIGHAEAAAGVGSLIKVLMAYQKNIIPRNIGIGDEINPVVAANISNRNILMVIENTSWCPSVPGKKRYAVANSFGAHGGNTTFLLEDAPTKVRKDNDPQTAYVVAISAKSKASLEGNLNSLLKYLDQNPNVKLGDLSYTLCARRFHHHTRIATSVTTIIQLKNFLASSTQNIEILRSIPLKPPPIAFAFTGQGAFYEGIGTQLFQHYKPYRDELLRLDQISQKTGFPSVVPSISNPMGSLEISPLITQLTLLIVEIALISFWERLGIKPSIVIGHSLGEYAALVCAGVLSAADAIYLVGKRAEIILATCKMGSHCMLSVRASVETIDKITGGLPYDIACLNSITDTVISGPREQIEAIQRLVEQSALKCVRLEIPFAFHSSQLDPMLDQFEETAGKVVFNPPHLPVISPLLGKCVQDGEIFNAKYLRRASREPVKFYASLEASRKMGITNESFLWIDIGSHPACQAFLRNHFPAKQTFSSLRRNEDNFSTITKTLAGLHCEGSSITWSEYYRPHENALNLLHLGHYHWNDKNYWIPYQGTWTLDKAHKNRASNRKNGLPRFSTPPSQPLISSSVRQITSDEILVSKRRLVALSDMMHASLRLAVSSHRIRKAEVASSSIWVDTAFTICEKLRQGSELENESISMDISDFEVFHSTMAQKDKSKAQLIQIEATLDLVLRNTSIQWYKMSADGLRFSEPLASATILYENLALWKREWRVTEHFVNDRIEALSQRVMDGAANKISRSMVYSLFKNIVEYDSFYQGINYVVQEGYEAFADITLDPDNHGHWFTPPHYIESVLQIAGFVMNCCDIFDHRDTFAVTPGWGSLRFAKRLEPGDKLRSYVRMLPVEKGRDYFGDIITTQAGVIIGICTRIKFRRVPRLLLDQFFASTDTPATEKAKLNQVRIVTSFPKAVSHPMTPTESETSESSVLGAENDMLAVHSLVETGALADSPTSLEEHELIADSLRLIARETGLGEELLSDDATFVELGVDSLMSLVLAQKLRDELKVEIQSSIFLECPCVKMFKEFMRGYY